MDHVAIPCEGPQFAALIQFVDFLLDLLVIQELLNLQLSEHLVGTLIEHSQWKIHRFAVCSAFFFGGLLSRLSFLF